MLHIEETIVVEGKYDKERLKKITDAPIVCTGGFSIYKNKQLIQFLKRTAEDKGIIILTDSDSAGKTKDRSGKGRFTWCRGYRLRNFRGYTEKSVLLRRHRGKKNLS